MSNKTPEEIEREQQRQLIEKTLDTLVEHWDNVQIFVNRAATDGDGTQFIHMGRGNLYARVEHVRDWVAGHDAQVREEARRDMKYEE